MFKLCVFLALSVASCYGTPELRMVCGQIPHDLHSCLVLPPAVSDEVNQKCKNLLQCERLTCTFRESNLLDGDVINRERTAAFFDTYAQDYPSFSTAIDHVKTECLGSVPLLPQGIFLNCPEFDIIHCVYKNLIKHAAPSQWSTSPNCTRARAFAAACPICPEECFRSQVPTGSCNACPALLPHSP